MSRVDGSNPGRSAGLVRKSKTTLSRLAVAADRPAHRGSCKLSSDHPGRPPRFRKSEGQFRQDGPGISGRKRVAAGLESPTLWATSPGNGGTRGVPLDQLRIDLRK